MKKESALRITLTLILTVILIGHSSIYAKEISTSDQPYVTTTTQIVTLSKLFAPTSAAPNTNVTMQIIANFGATGTTNIDVTDTLPSNMQLVSANSTCGGSLVTTTQQVKISGGSALSTTSCLINAVVQASLPGIYTNTTSALQSSTGSAAGASATLVIGAPPIVTQSFVPNAIQKNGVASYVMTITNTNTIALSGISVTNTLPSPLTRNQLSFFSNCGGTGTNLGTGGLGGINYSGFTLNAGASCTVSYTVTSGILGAYTSATSVVTATATQSASANAANSATLTVYDKADLTITKTDSIDPVALGTNFDYLITVNNNGPDSALNVIVTDTVPTGLSINSVSGTGWTCSNSSSGMVTCTMASLVVGASNPIDINVVGSSIGVKTNTATVAASNDVTTTNNAATITTTLTGPGVEVTKTFKSMSYVGGGSTGQGVAVYTVTLHNTGNADGIIADFKDIFAWNDTTGGSCVVPGGIASSALNKGIQSSFNVTCTVAAPQKECETYDVDLLNSVAVTLSTPSAFPYIVTDIFKAPTVYVPVPKLYTSQCPAPTAVPTGTVTVTVTPTATVTPTVTSTPTSTITPTATLTPTVTATPTSTPTPTPTTPPSGATTVYLPLVVQSPSGIFGKVTFNGTIAPGVRVDLMRGVDLKSSTLVDSQNTDANGLFSFANFSVVTSLTNGNQYYVRYQNVADSTRLYFWKTKSISSYVQGNAANMGTFDIANVFLASPANNAAVYTPATFRWNKRASNPSDGYAYVIYDPVNTNIGGYIALGKGVEQFVLAPGQGISYGFSMGQPYLWSVYVYDSDVAGFNTGIDRAYGISFEERNVVFNSLLMSNANLQ